MGKVTGEEKIFRFASPVCSTAVRTYRFPATKMHDTLTGRLLDMHRPLLEIAMGVTNEWSVATFFSVPPTLCPHVATLCVLASRCSSWSWFLFNLFFIFLDFKYAYVCANRHTVITLDLSSLWMTLLKGKKCRSTVQHQR